MPDDNVTNIWLPIIARGIAAFCLQSVALKDHGKTTQARFLKNIGMPNKDSALILGIEENSLRALLSQGAKVVKKPTRKNKKRLL